MVPLLVLCVAACALAGPLPQRLTEEQFKARARSLDNSNVFMIQGYSQVRRQGGRSFNGEPINFPTLSVKDPKQVKVQGSRKVQINLADPVYKDNAETLNSIRDELEKINAAELDRFNQEQEAAVEVNDVPEVSEEEEVEVAADPVEVDVIIEEETISPAAEDDLTILELNTESTSDDEDLIATEAEEDVVAVEDVAAVDPIVVESIVDEEEGSGMLIPDMSLDMEAVEVVDELIKNVEEAENAILEEESTSVPLIDFGDIQEVTSKDV